MLAHEIHIRDPFVIAENNQYYLLGTTGDDPWGRASDLTLYQSNDLLNFEVKCVMVNDGSLDEYTNILGIDVPSLTIPVKPGRNLAIIFEVAAMNNRQRRMGYNAAEELNRRILGHLDGN